MKKGSLVMSLDVDTVTRSYVEFSQFSVSARILEREREREREQQQCLHQPPTKVHLHSEYDGNYDDEEGFVSDVVETSVDTVTFLR